MGFLWGYLLGSAGHGSAYDEGYYDAIDEMNDGIVGNSEEALQKVLSCPEPPAETITEPESMSIHEKILKFTVLGLLLLTLISIIRYLN